MVSSVSMDAMERLRRRIHELLDIRTHTGKLRQKRLAEHLGKSEAWLSNILEGRRGLRLTDLDHVADFFRVPPSELVRSYDTELEEVTPSERTLLRRLRRAKTEDRDAIYRFAGLADGHEIGHRASRSSTNAIKKHSGDGKVSEEIDGSPTGTDRASTVSREKATPHSRRTPPTSRDDQPRLRASSRDGRESGMETRAEATTAPDAERRASLILEPCE